MQELFLNIHHIEEHEASVLVLLFLREMYKAILFIEGNGREVCVNGDITESRLALNSHKHSDHRHRSQKLSVHSFV